MTSKHNKTLFIIVTLLVWTVFSNIQIKQSEQAGQLSLPITFDDNVYFNNASKQLEIIYQQGISKFFTAFYSTPRGSAGSVHSTITPTLGFALFGLDNSSPAKMNALLMLPIFLLLVMRFNTHTIINSLLGLTLLTIPVFGHLIIESRPDLFWGLGIAFFCALVSSKNFFTRKSLHLYAGIILGYLLLCKPSMSPILIGISGCILFCRALLSIDSIKWAPKKDIKIKFKAITLTAITALIVALPYYVTNFETIYLYIKQTAFGNLHHVWAVENTWLYHATYYSIGKGAHYIFGFAMVPLIYTIIILAFFARFYQTHFTSIIPRIPYLLTMIATYIVVSIPQIKTPFLGSVYGMMLLLLFIDSINYLASITKKNIFIIMAVLLFSYGIATQQWPYLNKYKTFVTVEKKSAYQKNFDKLFELIHNEFKQLILTGETITLYILGIEEYFNLPTLQFEARKRGLVNLNVLGAPFSLDFDSHLEKINEAHLVLLLNESILSKSPKIPLHANTQVMNKITNHIIESGNFQKIDDLTIINLDVITALKAKSIKNTWSPILSSSNLWTLEGPYLELNLPRVRWGIGPKTVLSIAASETCQKLILSGRSLAANNTIKIKLNGKLIKIFKTNSTPKFEKFSIPISPSTIQPTIEVEYDKFSNGNTSDKRKLAMLFDSIRVEEGTRDLCSQK